MLDLRNGGRARVDLTVTDRYASRRADPSLAAGATRSRRWSLERTRGWYDLTVTVRGDAAFARRYAGHLEDGGPSISDPGMGGLV